MKLKGVNYDVGRVLLGRLTRPTFNKAEIHRELEIIRNDLHCNAVKIQGFDLNRLIFATEDALDQGLEVLLAPEMFEKSPEETFDYTLKAAEALEPLCQKWPLKVVLSIGTELTLFMQGILEGSSVMERIGNPSIWEKIRSGTYYKPLNEYLAKTTEAVRRVFHGAVTYASVARIESVDWSIFDIVCIDAYRDKLIRNSFSEMIKSYYSFGKPVVIGEFGCCTYKGAEDLGGMGWDVVDWSKTPPRLKADYVYDQYTQANEIAEDLRIFDEVGVYGAFVFTFVQPATKIDDPDIENIIENLKFDPDAISYSLVKSYPNEHGTSYPDMSWEPKLSFKIVSDYYGTT